MFIKVMNAFREQLLLNEEDISIVKLQPDGDVFVHMKNGESHKLSGKCYETFEKRLCGEEPVEEKPEEPIKETAEEPIEDIPEPIEEIPVAPALMADSESADTASSLADLYYDTPSFLK